MRSDTLVEWLLGDDTGLSSKAIARRMAGLEFDTFSSRYHPSDPADLGRCLRLLELFPGWDIWCMHTVSDEWFRLVNNWGELRELYDEEKDQRKAPKTYARMQELIYPVGVRQVARYRIPYLLLRWPLDPYAPQGSLAVLELCQGRDHRDDINP